MSVALDKPYCSLSEVQDELRNHKASDEDAVATAINTASRLVDDYTKTDFWFHDHTTDALEVLPRWVIGKTLFLPWAIQQVDEISETTSGMVYTTDSYKVITGYEGTRIAGFGQINLVQTTLTMLRANESGVPAARWPEVDGVFTLMIKGKFGTTLDEDDDEETPPTDIPAGVKRATVLIAANISGKMQKTVTPLDGQRIELYDTRIPKEALALLRRWSVLTL